MQGNRVTKKTASIIFLGVAMALSLSAALVATAQTSQPQFIVTWRASKSFAPSSYQGRILPNQGSSITASLGLISQGKFVNLNSQTIYWYLNDNLLGGGVGKRQITFQPYGGAPNTLALKVELPNYNGGLLLHQIAIPIVQPTAVIRAPYPNEQFSGSSVAVQALSYFFNASSAASLAFSWSVNGQAAANAENPSSAQINFTADPPVGSVTNVSLTVRNPSDSTVAIATANFVYQKQL